MQTINIEHKGKKIQIDVYEETGSIDIVVWKRHKIEKYLHGVVNWKEEIDKTDTDKEE